ncbi:hypothetical protein C1645_813963 [Glomus cerebriforme]|uniref:Uncharacterized protein n=1 Tax=Glomus cerebriforme TaxID=658196 RepID=A0A397TM56_9GLOM|nr:hypothetical protein C1645_813963 [Glomus cerebriforme]
MPPTSIVTAFSLDAFVAADIPLEKVDKLQNWLHKYCIEGGFIPKSDTLRHEYLLKLFESHVNKLKEFFIHVDYLERVNNCTIGQPIIQTLVQWEIPFNLPQLVASDSAAYMKKCYRLSNPKNIPLSNTTRWNTWFRMAFYVYVRGFYNEESQENSTSIVEKINAIFTDQQSNEQTKPIFPFIEQRLQQLEARIISGKTMTNFGSTIDSVLQKFNSPLTAFCPVFQQAYDAA